MPSPQKITDGKVRFVDNAVQDFEGKLATVVTDIQNRAAKLITELEVDSNGRIISDTTNLQLALALQADIEQFLGDYTQVGRDILAQYPDLLKFTDQALAIANVDPSFTGVQQQSLLQLQRLDLSNFANIGSSTLRVLEDQIVRAVVAGRARSDIIKSLQEAEVSLGTAKTWADTSLHQFERHTRKMMYDNNPEIERFSYVGSLDNVTRPFCRSLLLDSRNERGFSRDEIDSLNNGQIDDVWISGGGFNCRHDWYPGASDRSTADVRAELEGLTATS